MRYLIPLALLTRLGLLMWIGPSVFPDSAGYQTYAAAILSHGAAFAPLPWGSEAVPLVIFRPAGYPLILAGAAWLWPGHSATLVVLVQAALTGLVLWLIVRVAGPLLGSHRAALAAGALYAVSESLLWDNAILPDSLYASLFLVVLFALAGHLLGTWRLRLPHILGLAALWGSSLSLRDNGLYFTILPLLLCLAIAAATPGRRLIRAAIPLGFSAVTAGFVVATVLLNQHRTGEAFFSITGLENWLRPAFDIARYHYAAPFVGDDPLDRLARAMPDYGFPSQIGFLVALHAACRCSPTAMQAMVFAKFLAVVLRHPLAYLLVVIHNFDFSGQAELIADPVATVNQLVQLGMPGGARIVPGLSLRSLTALARHFSLLPLLLTVLSAAAATVAIALFSLFLFGVPGLVLRAWRSRQPVTRQLALVGFLWLCFLVVSGAFSLVHYEARHALPVLPAGIIGALYVVRYLAAARSVLPPGAGRGAAGRAEA